MHNLHCMWKISLFSLHCDQSSRTAEMSSHVVAFMYLNMLKSIIAKIVLRMGAEKSFIIVLIIILCCFWGMKLFFFSSFNSSKHKLYLRKKFPVEINSTCVLQLFPLYFDDFHYFINHFIEWLRLRSDEMNFFHHFLKTRHFH